MDVVADETPWHAKRIVYETDNWGTNGPPTSHFYGHRPGRPAKLYVYRPSAPGYTPKPGVVFIHGGPVPLDYPAPTDWGQYQSWGQLTAASGAIGFTFDHNYTEFIRLEDAENDVVSAVSYVRSHAGEFGLDPDRICLWVCSGGGPLISWALREQPDYVRCIVIYYAYMDLRQKSGIVDVLSDDVVHRYSPAAWISKRRAAGLPILITKAGLDDPVLNQTIDVFADQATGCGLDIELISHKTGHHGFDVNDDDPTSRAIIARTLRFINQNT